MNIVNSAPPNYKDIVSVFPAAAKPGVIFTYGDTIYNPSGGPISDPLMAHEGIHCGRQGTEVKKWWSKYLVDPEFRLAEELPAHRAEYRAFKTICSDRNAINSYLIEVANRLSSPLYGAVITQWKARKEIMK